MKISLAKQGHPCLDKYEGQLHPFSFINAHIRGIKKIMKIVITCNHGTERTTPNYHTKPLSKHKDLVQSFSKAHKVFHNLSDGTIEHNI
jgi:hypothetical protein